MTSDGLSWVPADVDLNRPSAARVYDYYLGGGCNFEVDREFAKRVLDGLPEARDFARLNRGFLQRAVRFCAEQGITQFLDLGAGIPTVGPTHEVASEAQPGARVVYVDNEAVAVAHSRLLLDGNQKAIILQQDMREPEAILNDPRTRELLDLDQPIALMALAVLHFVSDEEEPYRIISRYRDAMAPGSYLILSHGTNEGRIGDRTQSAVDKYQQTSNPGYLRSRTETMAFFDGFELVEPGLVFTPEWRPEDPADVGDDPERSVALAGVGRKLD